jgi:hypothetical protein
LRLAKANVGVRPGADGGYLHVDRKKKFMKRVVGFALGMAIGTLIYTRFLSEAHQLDWGRAVFVGVFAGLGRAIYSLAWRRKNRKQ